MWGRLGRPQADGYLANLAGIGLIRSLSIPGRFPGQVRKAGAMAQRQQRSRPLIGWREWVLLPDLSPVPLKAKIDTGARTSTLHAAGLSVHERDGETWVEFEVHPIQRSQAERSIISYPITGFKQVRSSTGQAERRPLIRTPFQIGQHKFDIDVTLTSRDEMGFRMLLGRSAVRRRFWVDPGRSFLHPTQEVSAGDERRREQS